MNGQRGRSKTLWAAVDAPNSIYADAIRSIKLSLDFRARRGLSGDRLDVASSDGRQVDNCSRRRKSDGRRAVDASC